MSGVTHPRQETGRFFWRKTEWSKRGDLWLLTLEVYREELGSSLRKASAALAHQASKELLGPHS